MLIRLIKILLVLFHSLTLIACGAVSDTHNLDFGWFMTLWVIGIVAIVGFGNVARSKETLQ